MRAHTPLDVFAAGLKKLVVDAKANGAAVFIVTPPRLAGDLARNDINQYRYSASVVAAQTGSESFDAFARPCDPSLRSRELKTTAQPAAILPGRRSGHDRPISKVVSPTPVAPQTGQAGSGDSRTVRVSAASAS